MPSTYRASVQADEEQIMNLLAHVLSTQDEPCPADFELLRWKYWTARGDCADPRSFVADADGKIVAHVGLWPVTVNVAGARLKGVHMIDWASEPGRPGAGLALLQRISRCYDFVYAIGGSHATQTILPAVGFGPAGETLTWGRPLRPWRRILNEGTGGWRRFLSLGRDLLKSALPDPAVASQWSAVETSGEAWVRDRCERDETFFEYLSRCPAIRCLRFVLLSSARNVGQFALAIDGVEARLAGVWLDEPTPEAWSAVLKFAKQAAMQNTNGGEFSMRSCSELGAAAAQRARMRVRKRSPVLIKGDSAQSLPLGYQFVDNDAVFHGAAVTRTATASRGIPPDGCRA